LGVEGNTFRVILWLRGRLILSLMHLQKNHPGWGKMILVREY